MNIVPKDFTLHGLLNSPNEQFRIPSYQRRYAWQYNQQVALFRDIDMLLPGDGHLFGMLILHTEGHHGGINVVDVVDGQQRLTSITILLKVLHDIFEESKDSFTTGQIAQLLYCGDPKDKIRKLILGELDEPDMQNLFDMRLDLIKNPRVKQAYTNYKKLIHEGIQDEEEGWLKSYYQRLTQTAKIIRLDVQQSQDAYKLFETINNRGLRLSATDILKNFILGHAAKIGADKLRLVKDQWAELIIALDGINSDDFFRQYISGIYTRKISSTKLIEEFKKNYFKRVLDVDKLGEYLYNYGTPEEEDLDEDDYEEIEEIQLEAELNDEHDKIEINEYLADIVNAAKCYSKIWHSTFENQKINNKIDELKAIRSRPSYIFLMHFLQENGNTLKEKLKVLEMCATLMLRRHMTGQSTAYNDDIFAKLLRLEINNRYEINDIKNSFYADYPDDEEFEDRFPTHELKERVIDRARYILSKIEYHITGNTNELSINSTEDVHVEHIIPKKIRTKKTKKEFGDWESYLPGNVHLEHRKRVNRIGNMTLFSGKLNIKISNGPFLDKRREYQNSNIQLTKNLTTYKYFKFDHLDNRGKELAKIAISIWKL
ncbi:MAG: hypothetical protein CL596_02110 [Alteromonas sp.]|nr:hypothetical protein [Alteromonas sp.]MAY22487.1 hypothetical protein [Flavobacteriaceae bacterium]|tara:strand:+ start:11427 stop:13226 length:1800 start_codon:yes stop_codon:yes gene_type:complete